MRQQKIGQFGQFTPTGVDPSAGANLRALAGISEGVADLAFQKAGKTARKEGTLAGANSVSRDSKGNILNPALESDNTIFGESFNQAAVMAHKAQISMDVREDLDRLQEEHKLNPEGFKIAAAGRKKGLLGGMPEELALIVSQEFDASVANRNATLLDDSFKRESAAQKVVAKESIEVQVDDITNVARSGADTKELVSNLDAELKQWVLTGKVSGDQASDILENARERVITNKEIGSVEKILGEDPTIKDIEKAQDRIKGIKKTKHAVLNAEQKAQMVKSADILVNSAMNSIARKRAANNAALNGEIKDVNKTVGQIKANLNDGVETNKEQIDAVIERGKKLNAQTGKTSVDVGELQNELAEAQQVNTFSMKSAGFREAQESELARRENAGDLTIEGGELLRSIRKANTKVEAAINKDGIQYFQDQGLGDIGSLRLTDEEGNLDLDQFSADLESRGKKTLEAEAHYARDISPLTDFEAEQFGRLYNTQDAEKKGAILSGFVQGLGDQSIPALAQFSKKGASLMALSGAIMLDGGDPSLILQGQELLSAPSGKSLLPTQGDEFGGFDREIAGMLGHAFSRNAQQLSAVQSGIKAAYAALSAQAGDVSEEINGDRLEQSINVVTGGIVEHNGVKVSAPERGMDQGDFEDLIEGLTANIFTVQDQDLPPISKTGLLRNIKDSATFTDVGPGQYLVKLGGNSLVGTDGEPYIMDLRKLKGE